MRPKTVKTTYLESEVRIRIPEDGYFETINREFSYWSEHKDSGYLRRLEKFDQPTRDKAYQALLDGKTPSDSVVAQAVNIVREFRNCFDTQYIQARIPEYKEVVVPRLFDATAVTHNFTEFKKVIQKHVNDFDDGEQIARSIAEGLAAGPQFVDSQFLKNSLAPGVVQNRHQVINRIPHAVIHRYFFK